MNIFTLAVNLGKDKLRRFAEIATFKNVFQHGYENVSEGHIFKGKWCDYFSNNNPIVLELGCGKGEYTVGLAQIFPDKNFIGVDIKGNRLWKGAKDALDKGLVNVVFVRTRINFIESVFSHDEVSEIWITFPDPQPQESRELKRLSGPVFLLKYASIIKPGGLLHLKTDNRELYNYTFSLCKTLNYKIHLFTTNLYNESVDDFKLAKSIKTYYEKKFTEKGFSINYLSFSIK